MSEPHDVSSEASLHGLPVAHDVERVGARMPLEVLVSRFTDAVRRGERPSIDEYVARHPEWGEKIREIFPLIASLERWKGDKEVECLRRNVPDEFPVRRLGEYKLIRELGRGGMGLVFEAQHESSAKRYAVKLLPWRYAAGMAQWKERFQREAATIARLRHPNIVRVYAFGTDAGYCYYAMHLVEGVSLDWIIRRLRETNDLVYVDEIRRARQEGAAARASARRGAAGSARGLHRDSWIAFAHIGKEVALALGHAHESGVLHNDVKPANLLLEESGRVIVTDFGIGRRSENFPVDGEEHPTGTLRYMAPERLRGMGDTRSDVYALGVTLYELITQKPAFDSPDRRKLMEMIVEARPSPPRELVPNLPPALETIILNAMAPDPVDRYPFAETMAADLLRFINGQRVRSTRAGRLGRALRWYRRTVSRAPQA
jgi:serine/threonine protein kinase